VEKYVYKINPNINGIWVDIGETPICMYIYVEKGINAKPFNFLAMGTV
jgi:hypothetical protein